MKSFFITIAFTLLICCTAFAGETLKLADLLAEAGAGNPELSASERRYQSALERVPQAYALEDPMFGMGFTNVPVESFAFDQEDMTMKEVELSQKIPFYGKRGLRRDAAALDAAAMESEYREKVIGLRSEVKGVYYELYSIKKALELTEKNIELMGIFRKVAETSYSVGRGMMKDVLKAQVESSMLLTKKAELTREDRTKRAYLGSLLGRAAPVEGVVEEITPTKVAFDKDSLVKAALGARPAVKAADARIKKGSVMVELANREYFPDFEVTARYGQRDDLKGGFRQSDMLSAMVSINLPVWWRSKQGPAVREAASDRVMAEKEKDALTTEISYKVGSLLSEIEQDDRITRLYKEGVIPQATEDLSSATAGYEVGRVDFLTLLDSRRALYEYEMGYYAALTEREKAVSELEAATGTEF